MKFLLSGIIISFFMVTFLVAVPSYAKKSLQKSAPVSDVSENQQKLRYDVYAGGIHALQADLDIDLSKKGRYSLELSAQTYGLLGKLAPWDGTFESHGWTGKPNKTETHVSSTTWRDELEVKKYSYRKNGTFKEFRIEEDGKKTEIKKVDKKLTKGTSDSLTATLNMMQFVANGGECEGTTEVFDGKRRYKMVFKQKREVTLKKSRWNVYEGKALECTVEVQPIAGKWHKKPRGWMSIQEQGRKRGTMPTIWMAKMVEGQPAVPVKVRVKTSYGTLFMHMTQFESADKKIALAD